MPFLFTFDGSFFDMLARFIESETVDPMDLDWRGMLAAIGIVKGQPFTPDGHALTILDRAAKTAYKMSRVIGTQSEVGGRSFRIYPDRSG